jgi:tetratricopeptide (TPR) repeat protein
MEMKYLLFPFFYFLFCSSTVSKSANIESIISFGDSLFLKGNYFNALNEYQRAYFFAGSELKSQLGGKIANCYLVLNDFNLARSFYDSVLLYSKSESQRISCEFQKILCFMKEDNFGYALLKLNNLKLEDEIQLQRRKNLYQGICCFGIGQYDESYQYFMNSLLNTDTLRRLQLQRLYENQNVLKRPNSHVAIILSMIIPGTGQFYSGDIKDGLNSLLLLSGIFYLGTIVTSSGLVLIVPLFCKYYLGGIVHTKEIAERKRNEKKYAYYTNLMEIILK